MSFFVVDRASTAPEDFPASGLLFAAVIGLAFFFTNTPLSDFLTSFVVRGVDSRGLGLVDVGEVDSELTGGGFAAFSLAATALRPMFDSCKSRMEVDYSLTKIIELLPVHFEPQTFFFALLFKHRLQEQDFILL